MRTGHVARFFFLEHKTPVDPQDVSEKPWRNWLKWVPGRTGELIQLATKK